MPRRRRSGDAEDPTPEAPPSRSEFDLGGSPDRGRARVADIGDKLNRAWGRTVALPLNATPIVYKQMLPFGILMLDWRTHGGVVIGGANRLWGKKDTFKTTMCLRLLRSAQHHCRHCKYPLVVSPEDGSIDCRCPKPRWWLANPDEYAWLPSTIAIQVAHGIMPESAVWKTVAGLGRVPVLKCDPPPNQPRARAKEIALTETYRNEPWRSLYCSSEHTLTAKWVKDNGVDGENIEYVGCEFAENNLASIEESTVTKEFDLVIIDSTSMLETKGDMEKTLLENPRVAGKQSLMGRFISRYVMNSVSEGLTTRYRPTLVCTSQVSQKGIGNVKSHPFLGPTDGNRFDHGLALDLKMFTLGYDRDASNQIALAGRFGFEVAKSRVGASPGSTGEVKFWLKADETHPIGDSDDLVTVMDYARRLGRPDWSRNGVDGFIVEGSGSAKLTLVSDYVQDGSRAFPRVGDCERFLRENITIYDDLRRRVLDKLMADGTPLNVGERLRGDTPTNSAEAATDV